MESHTSEPVELSIDQLDQIAGGCCLLQCLQQACQPVCQPVSQPSCGSILSLCLGWL